MSAALENELSKIGLTDKEARVYLVSLSLGPATAQVLAAKATTPRPTTYVIIESLMKKGLMSSVVRQGKRHFVAASPLSLRQLYEDELRRAHEKKDVLEGLVPNLVDYATNADRPNATVFESEASLVAVRSDIGASGAAGSAVGTVHHIVSAAPNQPATLAAERAALWRELERAGSPIKVLAPQPGETGARIDVPSAGPLREVRLLAQDRFPFGGEVVLYDGKAFALSFGRKPVGVLIEDPGIARLFLAMFAVCWETLPHGAAAYANRRTAPSKEGSVVAA